MTTDRIDAYLDDLLDRLEGTPADRRRMLTEAEAHLRDSAVAFEQDGMDTESAQAAAIGAFGDGPTIVKAANRRSPAALLAALVRAGTQLAVYGFVAIGAAALLARVLALVTSTQWVYGAPAGYRFTPGRARTGSPSSRTRPPAERQRRWRAPTIPPSSSWPQRSSA